jgi:hypothetical protein
MVGRCFDVSDDRGWLECFSDAGAQPLPDRTTLPGWLECFWDTAAASIAFRVIARRHNDKVDPNASRRLRSTRRCPFNEMSMPNLTTSTLNAIVEEQVIVDFSFVTLPHFGETKTSWALYS